MGFWSDLLKIGSVAAAPFTGGLSLAGIPASSILDSAGKVATGVEAGRASGRVAQAGVNNNQDRLALERAQLAQSAPASRAKEAVQGDILANAKDFSYGAPTMVGNIPVPTSSGGLRPSIFSANTRALGGLQSAEALTRQQTGSDVPALSPEPTTGPTDSILNTAATIGSVGGLFSTIPRAVPKPTDPNQPYPAGLPVPYQAPTFAGWAQ